MWYQGVTLATIWAMVTMATSLATDSGPGSAGEVDTLDVLMPGVTTTTEDQYWCTAIEAPKNSYITSFEAVPEGDRTHHMMIFTCRGVSRIKQRKWMCSNPCQGSRIMFAWALHADPTHLPPDVGFRLGDSETSYIALQIHYKTIVKVPDHSGIRLTLTHERPQYMAGILIMWASSLKSIPPQKEKYSIDVNCKFTEEAPIFPFAFRVHAHTMARVITGYQYNQSWHLLGKGNPGWPQAFYPMKDKFRISKNDLLFGQCTYSSMDHHHPVSMGSTHNDEMCNFYMMYYTDPDRGSSYINCFGNKYNRPLPEGSDVPPPPNPLLEEIAHGNVLGIQEVSGWPSGAPELGQVAGIATDLADNVVIFHRGSTTWNAQSFKFDNVYKKKDSKPIKEKTIITFNSAGKVIGQWGEDKFYMPHGLHIDSKNNIWVTDVALHQVMRFPAGKHEPDLTLGTKFEPGNDVKHFCKPTGVATLANGQFYVSDGYCNHRIIKYSADGKVLNEWGVSSSSLAGDGYPPPSSFDNPHSITVQESLGLVCVADRENQRIQCFDLEGNYQRQMHKPDITGKVFGVAFNPKSGVLYAVNGEGNYNEKIPLEGFTFDATNGELKQTWGPQSKSFSRPHDIAVSSDGHAIYVSEIGPNRVWKFNITHGEGVHLAVKKGGRPATMDDLKEDDSDVVKEKVGQSDFGASLIIGGLLVIPVLIIVIVTIILRLKRNGSSSDGPNYRKVDQMDFEIDSDEEVVEFKQNHV